MPPFPVRLKGRHDGAQSNLLAPLGALGLYGWALRRVKREYRDLGRLTPATAAAAYAAYALHALLTGEALRRRTWPLPIERALALGLGIPPALFGAVLFLAGWRSLPTANDSGLATGGLVTKGVYRLSRNPQNVGWALLLAGSSLARRSGAGLLLSALFLAALRAYLPVEEAFLARRYGAAYERYRRRVPRFLGWPRGGIPLFRERRNAS